MTFIFFIIPLHNNDTYVYVIISVKSRTESQAEEHYLNTWRNENTSVAYTSEKISRGLPFSTKAMNLDVSYLKPKEEITQAASARVGVLHGIYFSLY